MPMYRNSTYALANSLANILDDGDIITVHGQLTKEIVARHLVIDKPVERCIMLPHRNDNIFAKIAETLWVLAGRNDIAYLTRYLPRAPDFSDDGLTWRAGYGERLRHFGGDFDVDQMNTVVQVLRADPMSRQAVISLWDPVEDRKPSKDIPCNNWLQFLIRPYHVTHWNESHIQSTTGPTTAMQMLIAQRSSDCLWGFSGINTFEWSYLHEMMSHWNCVPVGSLHYTLGSFHVYQRHWERARQISEEFNNITIYDMGWQPVKFSTNYEQFDWLIQTCMRLEDYMRQGEDVWNDIQDIPDDLFRASLEMLRLYNYWLNNKDALELDYQAWVLDNTRTTDQLSTFIGMFITLEHCDFKMAAIEYFWRCYPALILKAFTSTHPADKQVLETLKAVMS